MLVFAFNGPGDAQNICSSEMGEKERRKGREDKQICVLHTLQGTNISPKNGIFEDDFPFPVWWDMLVP